MKTLINSLITAGIEEVEAKKEISILISEFGESNLEKIESIVNERIKSRTPLQYLIGKAYFMDFAVNVNPKVLIPRPETEILVEETVKRFLCHSESKMKNLIATRDLNNAAKVLDIGTGTGVIPIALAKKIPDSKITAIDIDKEIIALASENAKLNKVEDKINFKICDVFSNCFEGLLKANSFDLIISNPPYVRVCHGKLLQPEVRYEPEIALSGTRENKSGLIYYERIVELICRERSRPFPTLVAFEIDPPLVSDLKLLLKKYNLNNFEIIKDYSKLDRCLFVYL